MEEKILVAFDFDNTIIDANSDLHVRKLAPNGKIPAEIKSKYTSKNWTVYMGLIFRYLHKNGATQTDIDQCMREIPFTAGMKELLLFLENNVYEVIIISDSNSYFINCIMESANLNHVVRETFTNPANFNDTGCLEVEYYHTQDWCERSTINLCKGHILESYITDRRREGVNFRTVGYVGDGTNDLCPSLRLRQTDVVYPRKGFSLMKSINNLDADTQLLARVCQWETGLDIIESLKTLSN